MIRRILTTAALALGLAMPAAADPLAKNVFSSVPGPTGGPAQVFGSYAKGCGTGFVQLPESGPTWQAMRLSRNRNWGHPELVSFLIGLSKAARQVGWQGLYIGDMSQPRGGVMNTGHASHQMGLDADIWVLPPSSLRLSPGQRETLGSPSVVDRKGTGLTGVFNGGHMAIIRAAANDPRVERIFIDPVAKVAMCQLEKGNRGWLRKVRPLNNHDHHFHVRLGCPAGSAGCQPQTPPPPGDGCAEAMEWIKNRIDPSRMKPVKPDPNYRHPRSYRMSEMPKQCQAVAAAR